MKTIVETKTEKYYCITEEEAKYLYDFLGNFSDTQIADVLGVGVESLQDSAGNSIHYYLWNKLDEELKSDEEK